MDSDLRTSNEVIVAVKLVPSGSSKIFKTVVVRVVSKLKYDGIELIRVGSEEVDVSGMVNVKQDVEMLVSDLIFRNQNELFKNLSMIDELRKYCMEKGYKFEILEA